jgi:ABC-type uncharacterized transport system substrate-binding protein
VLLAALALFSLAWGPYAPALSVTPWQREGSPGVQADAPSHLSPVRKPFRIIYVEGGSYAEYYLTLAGLVRGLHALGMVEDGDPPLKPDSTDTLELWSWISRSQGEGAPLEFLEDGFYSAGWSTEGRDKVRRSVADRVARRGDVDLILAFGTRAGLDFALEDLGVPVMSLATIDPEGSGFAPQPDGPPRPWAHVFVRRDRIPAQLSLFHGTFNFRRLGVPVEDDREAGRLSMAWPAIEKAATRLGFETVPCYASMEIPDRDLAFRNLMGCLNRLTRETDAIYLTVNNGMLRSRMGEILSPIAEAGIPSFSQEGSEAVRAGVLMSAGQDDYDDIGLFEARALREIVYGAVPGEIPGIYRAHASVSINLTMALRIGWNPPFEILVAADQIYQGMAEPFREGHPSWAVRTGGFQASGVSTGAGPTEGNGVAPGSGSPAGSGSISGSGTVDGIGSATSVGSGIGSATFGRSGFGTVTSVGSGDAGDSPADDSGTEDAGGLRESAPLREAEWGNIPTAADPR